MRNDYESNDEDFDEDTKTNRQKRMANRRKHSRHSDREQRLRPVKNTKPRVKAIEWNPDLDEEDYEEYYYD